MTEHEQNSKFTKNKRQDGENKMDIQEWIIFAIELIGTVAFSASGAMVGIECSMDIFGVIVLGVSTAVGGGMVRDVMYIFVKHIYACASIAGAWICVIIYRSYGELPAMVVSSLIVMLIRFLAAHYRWNLPRIGE